MKQGSYNIVLCWLLLIGVGIAWAANCTYSSFNGTTDNGDSFTLNQVYPEGFETRGQGLSATDPSQCRIKRIDSNSSGMSRDGSSGVNPAEEVWFVVSGSVCLVQTVVSRSMFHIYCTLALEMEPVLLQLLALYIIMYGIAILFGINNASLREVIVRMVKVTIVIVFITNADAMFFYLYEGLLTFTDEFSELLLSSEPLYDAAGNVAMGKRFGNAGDVHSLAGLMTNYRTEEYVMAQNGGECMTFLMPERYWPTAANAQYPIPGNCECLTDKINWRLCNGSAGEVPEWCAYDYDKILRDCFSEGNFTAGQDYCTSVSYPFTVSDCRIPVAPTDVYGEPIWEINAQGKLQRLAEDGTYCGSGAACRQPYSAGVFSRLDTIFRGIVGLGNQGSAILLMAMAVGLAGNNMGWILTILAVSGIIASFWAFFRLVAVYITAFMTACFLLMFTPIFFAFFLFQTTDLFFKRWLQSVLGAAIQPMLIIGFLFAVTEVASVHGLINGINQELVPNDYNRLQTKEYHGGWEGFWQVTFNGVGFENYSCTYNGVEATECSTIVQPGGSDINYACKDSDGVFHESGCDADSFVCDVENNISGDACVQRRDLSNISLRLIGIVVAWLIVSSLVAGFSKEIPIIAARLTNILGTTMTRALGNTSMQINDRMNSGILGAGLHGKEIYTLEGAVKDIGQTAGGLFSRLPVVGKAIGDNSELAKGNRRR